MATESVLDSNEYVCPQPPHLKYDFVKFRPKSLENYEYLTKLDINVPSQQKNTFDS